MAIEPPAPSLFSTTTGWPRLFASSLATTRDTMSAVLPGASGTTMRSCLAGHGWAAAKVLKSPKTTAVQMAFIDFPF
jgi:hypothetical protein